MIDTDNILNFWFPNNKFNEFWFNHEKDQYIINNYKELLDEFSGYSISKILDYIETSKDKKNTVLSIVILLDQFTRNIYRYKTYTMNDKLCLQLVNHFYELNYHKLYPVNEWVFFMLPFRHTKDKKYLDLVLKELSTISPSTEYDKVILAKFKKATLKDYSSITSDIIIIEGSDKHQSYFDFSKYKNIITHRKESMHPITRICMLDREDYPMDNFNREQYDILSKHNLYQNLRDYIDIYCKDGIIGVSLSGGVDSMVLVTMLKYMELYENHRLKIYCIHIDYANRSTSDTEVEFITKWCCDILGYPLFIKKICHMKRGEIDRLFYETESKNIRFNTYKYAMESYSTSTGIMLGHHKDDLSENVFMNIIRNNDLLDLYTMTEHSFINNVNILRPMLKDVKNDIYDISELLNVPYLIDTTPENCLRGMIRRTIYPTFDMMDPRISDNIVNIGKQSTQWGNIVNNMIIIPLLESIEDNKYGFSFDYNDNMNNMPVTFWCKLLSRIFHERGVKMMSHKNVCKFVTWLTGPKSRKSHTYMNNERCLLPTSNGYFIFYNKKKLWFVWAELCKKTNYKYKLDMTINEIDDIFVDKWKISVRRVKNDDIDDGNGIQIKDILNGKFKVYYKCPSKHPYISYSCGQLSKSFSDVKCDITKYIPKIGVDKYLWDNKDDWGLYEFRYDCQI